MLNVISVVHVASTSFSNGLGKRKKRSPLMEKRNGFVSKRNDLKKTVSWLDKDNWKTGSGISDRKNKG